MNQPDRYDRFAPREDESKVTFARDQKLPNAGVLSILREDHTAGNLLRCALHEDPAVVFAGYRIPHPLEPLMEVRVQTVAGKAPVAAVSGALNRVGATTFDFGAQFEAQVVSIEQASGWQTTGREPPEGTGQPHGHGQPQMPPHYQQQQMPQQQPQQPYGGGYY
jgi:DNA-directed RNA polymerase II subunit RPB11